MIRPRLTPDEVREIARDYVDAEIHRTAAQDQPRAMMLAGQSGAGKSTMVDTLGDELATRGGYIHVSADIMRTRLPYLDELDTNSPDFAPQTAGDAGALAIAVREEAMARRRHVVIDGTLWNPDAAVALAKALKQAGYQTELHALAVNDQISYQRAATRYERERASEGFARWTVRELHDRSFHGMADSVRRLEFTGAVDRVAIYNRLGDAIHDQAPTPGQAIAAPKLERARSQLTTFERINLASNWDEILDSMERRSAHPDEKLLVQAGQERAHYTLRSSREAAEVYDSQYPMEGPSSRAYAASYGARLASAFRAGRGAEAMPELATAYQVKLQAMDAHGGASEAERTRMERQYDRQIMECLIGGRAPVCEVQTPVQREFEVRKKEVNDIVESFRLVEQSGMTLDESDRRDLREAQKRLADFIDRHAGQLRRELPATLDTQPGLKPMEPAHTSAPAPRG